jgi:methyl-accepting chemotaxis protein
LSFLSKLFGLFSYRQRFLTPAVAYILCTPYPVYVVIETCKFWIRQYEWQIEGNGLQKEMNDLLSNISLYPFLSTDPEGSETLIRSIHNGFAVLNSQNHSQETTYYILADGYSRLRAPSISTKDIYEKWNEYRKGGGAATVSHEQMQDMTEGLRRQLFRLGYSYALFQGHEVSTQSYVNLTLEHLPRIVEMTRRLVTTQRLLGENPAQPSQIVALYNEIRREKESLERVFDRFYATFRETHRFSIKELDPLRKSFIDFTTLLTEFIDQRANGVKSPGKDHLEFSDVVWAKDKMIQELYDLQEPVLQHTLSVKKWFYYAFLSQFFFLLLVVWFLVKHRGLSIHLIALRDHINNLAQGNLSYCFTTHEKDEFGIIGKAVDKVVDVIGIIVGDLVSFSKQIEEITVRVSWAVREQEETLLEQEKIITEGKKSAQQISERARFLSNLLSEMCESSQLTVQAEHAHSDLKKMRANMDALVRASGDFLLNFNSFSEKVISTQKKVNFMDHLGDQAKMLSLNGKIENAGILKTAANFSEITKKIERFSDNSEEATSRIKKIIKESMEGVKAVKTESLRCLSEISAGVGQLNLVSMQLEEIAKLGEDQQRKFLKVDELMKVQAGSSQKIIENIQNLLTPANENAALVQQIPKILGDIIEQQKKLTNVIGKVRFFHESR